MATAPGGGTQRFTRGNRDYARNKKVINDIFEFFAGNKAFRSLTELHDRYGVPCSTLSRWRHRSETEPDWRPYNFDARGRHHRVFTDEEEDAIKSHIVDNNINTGIGFRGVDFVSIAMQAFLEKHSDTETIKDFKCSAHFTRNFMKRNHLSLRRGHYKRRPPERNDAVINDFVADIVSLLRSTDHNRVINADETAWFILPSDTRTWAETGSDSVVLQTVDDDKKKLTVMASITAAGTKLPLFVIAKGKSKRCEESQIGDISPHVSSHSEASWMTTACFEEYLRMIRQQYPDNDPLFIIVDSFSVHKAQSAMTLAAELNITLKLIPPGMTNLLQPLDLRIFGVLKSIGGAHLRRMVQESPYEKIGMKRAVSVLVRAWSQLSEETIRDSWSVYLDRLEE